MHGLKELEFRRALPLPNGMREGWGLTTDDAGKLYASDGTDTLHVLDARTLEVLRRIKVRSTGGPLGSRPVSNLNDLQWVRGEIWANLWYEDRLAVIDPESGNVRGYINLEALLSPKERRSLRSQEECLNGIAYDADADELYVTGKCWPKVRAHCFFLPRTLHALGASTPCSRAVRVTSPDGRSYFGSKWIGSRMPRPRPRRRGEREAVRVTSQGLWDDHPRTHDYA